MSCNFFLIIPKLATNHIVGADYSHEFGGEEERAGSGGVGWFWVFVGAFCLLVRVFLCVFGFIQN